MLRGLVLEVHSLGGPAPPSSGQGGMAVPRGRARSRRPSGVMPEPGSGLTTQRGARDQVSPEGRDPHAVRARGL